MTHRPPSRGDLISTLCFAGVGVWCAGTAAITPGLQAFGLAICALACFAGAARHPLARLLARRVK